MEQESLPPMSATTTEPTTNISENQSPGNALTGHSPFGKKLEEGNTGQTGLSKQFQPINSNGPTQPTEPPASDELEKYTDTNAFGYAAVKSKHRHHFKRRSTSKVHVSKILQMTKGNDKSSEDGESSGRDSETEQKRLSRNVVGLKRSNSSSSTKRRSKNLSNDLATVGEWRTEFDTEFKKEGKAEGMVESKTEVERKDGTKNERQSDGKEFGQESTAQRSSKTPIHSLSTPSMPTSERRKSKRLSGGPIAAAVQADGVIVTAPSKAPPGVTNSTVLARDMAVSPGYARVPSKSKFHLNTPSISPSSTADLLTRNNNTVPTNLSPSLSQHSEGRHRAAALQSPSEEEMSFQQSSLNGHASQAGAVGSTSQPGALSRTQQKLLLQRQHFLAGDDNYLEHPRNMARITREMERINREYSSVLLYEHPMEESLRRCMDRKRIKIGIGRQRANSGHQKYNTVIGIVGPLPEGGKSGSHGSTSGDENQQRWSGSPGKLLGRMLVTN